MHVRFGTNAALASLEQNVPGAVSHCCPQPGSDLKYIAIVGNHLVEHWVYEEAEEEPRDKTRYDYDRKRFLCVRTNAG